jgi:hypothetical protein
MSPNYEDDAPMPLAYIRFIDERTGRPVDPDYGVDEGHPGAPGHPDHGFNPGHPDQGLPGRPGRPPRPGQGLPPSGRPIDPGFGWGGGGEHPGHLPSRPGGRPIDPGFGWGGGERPGHLPSHGGRPVDPGYGVEEGGNAGQLPIWPVGPDQGLPPVPGHPLPPVDPPPGTVWPPLPPSVEPGKVIALVAISGIGYRYVVLTVPPKKPDQGLPGSGDIETKPEHPIAPTNPTTPTQPIAPQTRHPI